MTNISFIQKKKKNEDDDDDDDDDGDDEKYLPIKFFQGRVFSPCHDFQEMHEVLGRVLLSAG